MKPIDYRKNISIVIRNERIKLGLTQEAMAHKSGMNTTYYSKVERGENSVSLDKLASISEQLNIPLSKLFKMAENV